MFDAGILFLIWLNLNQMHAIHAGNLKIK